MATVRPSTAYALRLDDALTDSKGRPGDGLVGWPRLSALSRAGISVDPARSVDAAPDTAHATCPSDPACAVL